VRRLLKSFIVFERAMDSFKRSDRMRASGRGEPVPQASKLALDGSQTFLDIGRAHPEILCQT